MRKIKSCIRWNYVNLVRIGLGQATFAKDDDILVLYKSDHFVVINKQQDVKINSNDPSDLVTVETQLRKLYPEHIDHQATHSFR